MQDDVLILGGKTFTNRLLTGTGKFGAHAQIPHMLAASGSQMITVALRRVDITEQSENILEYIPKDVTLLPNTSGARTAEQAVRIARIAREAGCGTFIKIEVITDMKYLMPDNWETLRATEILAKEGFQVSVPTVAWRPSLCLQCSLKIARCPSWLMPVSGNRLRLLRPWRWVQMRFL